MRSSTVRFPVSCPTRQPPRYRSASRFHPLDSAAQKPPPRAASGFACAHRRPLPAHPPRASVASSPRRRRESRRRSRPDLFPLRQRENSARRSGSQRAADTFPQPVRHADLAEAALEAPPAMRRPGRSNHAMLSYPTRPHSREARRPHQPPQAARPGESSSH